LQQSKLLLRKLQQNVQQRLLLLELPKMLLLLELWPRLQQSVKLRLQQLLKLRQIKLQRTRLLEK
jgi:hypothetical protein